MPIIIDVPPTHTILARLWPRQHRWVATVVALYVALYAVVGALAVAAVVVPAQDVNLPRAIVAVVLAAMSGVLERHGRRRLHRAIDSRWSRSHDAHGQPVSPDTVDHLEAVD